MSSLWIYCHYKQCQIQKVHRIYHFANYSFHEINSEKYGYWSLNCVWSCNWRFIGCEFMENFLIRILSWRDFHYSQTISITIITAGTITFFSYNQTQMGENKSIAFIAGNRNNKSSLYPILLMILVGAVTLVFIIGCCGAIIERSLTSFIVRFITDHTKCRLKLKSTFILSSISGFGGAYHSFRVWNCHCSSNMGA